MPNLTFVLPHWLYWAGLILFPLGAMYIVRQVRTDGRREGSVNLPTAYLFWIFGGFVGIHRLYLRNWWGLVYIPLFICVLLVNVEIRDHREYVSNANNQVLIVEFDLEEAQNDLKEGRDGAQAAVEKQTANLEAAKQGYQQALEDQELWNNISLGLAILIGLMLLVDAVLLPGMTRKAADHEHHMGGGKHAITEVNPREGIAGRGHPADHIQNAFTSMVDRISGFTGEFVGYWSLLAVFVYYYEVIARYVFNSPTNWAHEGMFLMFGMQYLVSGSLALREDSHVRVDILYLKLSHRGQAILNIITSAFFFLFTVSLLVTGLTFAMDSISVWEVSFTEWAIQYWPVKLIIPLGGLLITLQGLTILVKDLIYLTGKEA